MDPESKHRILLIAIWPQHRRGIAHYLKVVAEALKNYEIVMPNCCLEALDTDLFDIYRECREIVKDQEIKSVLSVCNGSSLIVSALLEAYPYLKGTPFDIQFLTTHRVLMRQYAIPSALNLPFSYLWTKEGYPIEPEEVEQAVRQVIEPTTAKPSLSISGKLAIGICSVEDYDKLDVSSNEVLKSLIQPLRKLIVRFWNYAIFQEVLRPSFAIERDLNSQQSTIHLIDGLVCKGSLVPWAISDEVSWENEAECFQGYGLPSALNAEMRIKAWNVLQLIVDHMKRLGYDNQFLHTKVYLLGDNTFKVAEVHGWMLHKMRFLYDKVLKDGSMYLAMIDVSQEHFPRGPLPRPGLYGLLAPLFAPKEGLLGDIINYKFVHRYDHIELFYTEQDKVAAQTFLGFVHQVGADLQDCINKVQLLKCELFREYHFSSKRAVIELSPSDTSGKTVTKKLSVCDLYCC